jgi:hypothetical protein
MISPTRISPTRLSPTRLTSGFAATLAAALLIAAPVGCNSKNAATPENFIATLNSYFVEHPDCLFPESPTFPYETTDPVKTKQMNALVASQLLTVAQEPDIHVSRYTPTSAGARAAPRFCYGHRVITSIDSFTPPTPVNGFPESQIAYHYSIEDMPVWAETAAMRAAFPAMALKAGGTASDKAVLARTMAGWQVPD